jgi:Putative Actinobacterial Holin-X, holin superfamily III
MRWHHLQSLGVKPIKKIADSTMATRTDRPIPELLSDVLGQLAKLIGNEFDLAKAELSDKASQVGRGVMMIAAGAVFMIPAFVLLLMAAAAALMHAGYSDPVAYLVTGGAGRSRCCHPDRRGYFAPIGRRIEAVHDDGTVAAR